ncbi:plasmid stabilization protein [Leptobacterium sp. I13]|uniref:type II toxin-antitoxin system RelE family toxin n=1 Tax=Leptobacterium meishanense TaxID=3128904 RepID=UPI0030ECB676
MHIIYTRAITKDARKIKDEKTKADIRKLIEILEKAISLKDIPNIKKLKGHPEAYRIRIRDYRLGLYCDGKNIVLSRLLKRNDIYKVFP